MFGNMVYLQLYFQVLLTGLKRQEFIKMGASEDDNDYYWMGKFGYFDDEGNWVKPTIKE